jgi:hypothetical protein
MGDHVHMLLSIPSKYSLSGVLGFIKGKSAIAIVRNYTWSYFISKSLRNRPEPGRTCNSDDSSFSCFSPRPARCLNLSPPSCRPQRQQSQSLSTAFGGIRAKLRRHAVDGRPSKARAERA